MRTKDPGGKRRVTLTITIGLALLSALVGCGDKSANTNSAGSEGAKSPSAEGKSRNANTEARLPRSLCRNAGVAEGAGSGVLTFWIRCAGAGAAGTNRAFLTRVNPNGVARTVDIVGVSRHLESVSGTGRGSCRLRKGTALCTVNGRRSVVVAGTLRVAQRAKCHGTVAVYVVFPPQCATPRACNLQFNPKDLFRGRPDGCEGG